MDGTRLNTVWSKGRQGGMGFPAGLQKRFPQCDLIEFKGLSSSGCGFDGRFYEDNTEFLILMLTFVAVDNFQASRFCTNNQRMKEPVLEMQRSDPAVTRHFFSMELHKDRFLVLLLFYRLLLFINTAMYVFLAGVYHLPHILLTFAYDKQCSHKKKN